MSLNQRHTILGVGGKFGKFITSGGGNVSLPTPILEYDASTETGVYNDGDDADVWTEVQGSGHDTIVKSSDPVYKNPAPVGSLQCWDFIRANNDNIQIPTGGLPDILHQGDGATLVIVAAKKTISHNDVELLFNNDNNSGSGIGCRFGFRDDGATWDKGIWCLINNAGTVVDLSSKVDAITDLNPHVVAFSYKNNGLADDGELFIDGVSCVQAMTAKTPSSGTAGVDVIGSVSNSNTHGLNGYIFYWCLYDERLTTAQHAQLNINLARFK